MLNFLCLLCKPRVVEDLHECIEVKPDIDARQIVDPPPSSRQSEVLLSALRGPVLALQGGCLQRANSIVHLLESTTELQGTIFGIERNHGRESPRFVALAGKTLDDDEALLDEEQLASLHQACSQKAAVPATADRAAACIPLLQGTVAYGVLWLVPSAVSATTTSPTSSGANPTCSSCTAASAPASPHSNTCTASATTALLANPRSLEDLTFIVSAGLLGADGAEQMSWLATVVQRLRAAESLHALMAVLCDAMVLYVDRRFALEAVVRAALVPGSGGGGAGDAPNDKAVNNSWSPTGYLFSVFAPTAAEGQAWADASSAAPAASSGVAGRPNTMRTGSSGTLLGAAASLGVGPNKLVVLLQDLLHSTAPGAGSANDSATGGMTGAEGAHFQNPPYGEGTAASGASAAGERAPARNALPGNAAACHSAAKCAPVSFVRSMPEGGSSARPGQGHASTTASPTSLTPQQSQSRPSSATAGSISFLEHPRFLSGPDGIAPAAGASERPYGISGSATRSIVLPLPPAEAAVIGGGGGSGCGYGGSMGTAQGLNPHVPQLAMPTVHAHSFPLHQTLLQQVATACDDPAGAGRMNALRAAGSLTGALVDSGTAGSSSRRRGKWCPAAVVEDCCALIQDIHRPSRDVAMLMSLLSKQIETPQAANTQQPQQPSTVQPLAAWQSTQLTSGRQQRHQTLHQTSAALPASGSTVGAEASAAAASSMRSRGVKVRSLALVLLHLGGGHGEAAPSGREQMSSCHTSSSTNVSGRADGFLGLYLCFSSRLPRPLLEAVQAGCQELVDLLLQKVVAGILCGSLAPECDVFRGTAEGSYAVLRGLEIINTAATCTGAAPSSCASPGSGRTCQQGSSHGTSSNNALTSEGAAGSRFGLHRFDRSRPGSTGAAATIGFPSRLSSSIISGTLSNENDQQEVVVLPEGAAASTMPRRMGEAGRRQQERGLQGRQGETQAPSTLSRKGLPRMSSLINSMATKTTPGTTPIASPDGACSEAWLLDAPTNPTSTANGPVEDLLSSILSSIRSQRSMTGGQLLSSSRHQRATRTPGTLNKSGEAGVGEGESGRESGSHLDTLSTMTWQWCCNSIIRVTGQDASELARQQMDVLVSSIEATNADAVASKNINRSAFDEDLESLQLREILGRGAGGVVLRGLIGSTSVAVKLMEMPIVADKHSGVQADGRSDKNPVDAQKAPDATADGQSSARRLQAQRILLRNAMELWCGSQLSHPNIVQVYTTYNSVLLKFRRIADGAPEFYLEPVSAAASSAGPRAGVPTSGAPVGHDGAPATAGIGAPSPPCQEQDPNEPTDSTCTALVVEWCDMGSLASMLSSRAFPQKMQGQGAIGAPLYDMKDVYLTLLDIALALRHLHAQGVVHRDLKPGNLLLKSNPRDYRGFTVKLADFGLALKLSEVDLDGVLYAIADQPCGTVTHMAPEALSKPRFARLSAAVDVFSFGIIMWELLAGGKQPYHKASLRAIPDLVVKGCRPSFAETVPQSYRHLAAACWSASPAERPSAARLVAAFSKELSALTA